MKISYGKTLTTEEKNIVLDISFNCGILYDTAKLLFYRGIDTIEKAKQFLNPSKKDFLNPFLFKDMQKVVDRINQAKQNLETVLVYGDYDVDGVCATTILTKALKSYGIKTIYAIPEREEGYGLNLEKIENLSNENIIDLIITVDCGISEHDNISQLLDLGIDVIVSDHHEAPEVLPNTLIINPKVKDEQFPFKGLCGAGVAYKIAYALLGAKADEYLDFVALATVADSMDLIEENRSLVSEGLKIINSSKIRSCFKLLLGETNKKILAQTLAFTIAPKLNAGGRMGDANTSLKLFISDDETEIYDCAVKLFDYNLMRQAEGNSIYNEAKAIIEKNNMQNDSVIVVGDSSWKSGVTGIVAARLVDDYNRPAIVFASYDDDLKGSARSVEEINIYQAISSVSDILVAFGGHSQAAGVTISKNNFELFRKRINEYVRNSNLIIKEEKEVYADWQIDSPVSIDFAREVELLEPFGIANRKPCFTITEGKIESKRMKANSPHFIFSTSNIEMLDFNGEHNVFDLSLPIEKKILFELNYSVFKEKESVKGILKNVILDYSSLANYDLYKFRDELLHISRNTENNFDFSKYDVSVERGVFENYFNLLASLEGKRYYNSVEYAISAGNIDDKPQFILCSEVFMELKIFSCHRGVLERNRQVKSSLYNSVIYKYFSNRK